MKTLYIIRHAKSSWENPLLDDFSRPLNDRGKRDAPRMAKRLKEKKIKPDLLLSSPARRALATAKRMAEGLDVSSSKIKTDAALYHASVNTLFETLSQLKDKYDHVMLFGHNPGLTDFVNELLPLAVDNLPTCAVVACSFDIDTWADLKSKKGKLLFYDFPKSKST